MRSPSTITIEFDGRKAEVLKTPPPHVMFLGSKMQGMEAEPLQLVALSAGIAGLCVRSIDGEAIEYGGKLPRDMEALASFGSGFLMSLFEQANMGLDDAVGLFEAVLSHYKAKGAPNPT